MTLLYQIAPLPAPPEWVKQQTDVSRRRREQACRHASRPHGRSSRPTAWTCPDSDIVQEPRVVVLVHVHPRQQRRQGEARQGKMRRKRRDGSGKDNLPHVGDVAVDRIACKHKLKLGAKAVRRVEDRRTVHQQLQEHAPEVVDVAEEDEKRGKHHADAEVERHKGGQREGQQQKPPGEVDAVQPAEEEEHDERKEEVDKRLDGTRKEEQVFRNIHLCKYAGIGVQTLHSVVCGVREPSVQQVPAEEIRGVVGDGPPEELLEDDLHHEQRQQGHEQTPAHTKDSALVLLLEVALDQLLEEKPMPFQLLKHLKYYSKNRSALAREEFGTRLSRFFRDKRVYITHRNPANIIPNPRLLRRRHRQHNRRNLSPGVYTRIKTTFLLMILF